MSGLTEALGLIYGGVSAPTAMVEYRHPVPEDFLPKALSRESSLGALSLDPEWAWVAVRRHQIGVRRDIVPMIVAAVLAAPYHGRVLIGRIVALPGEQLRLGFLLRRFVRDLRDMGYTQYFTWLYLTRDEERRLLHILRKAGAIVIPQVHLCVQGRVGDLARW